MIFNNSVRKLNILGCGGHARSVADIAIEIQPMVELLFFDENACPDEYIIKNRYAVLKPDKFTPGDNDPFIVAIGDNTKRDRIFHEFKNGKCLTVISNNAHISELAEIGIGVFVGNYSHIGPEASVGDNCIINNGAIVEHETVIGDSSHISVGAKVCGRSRVGSRVMIGAGATVIDKVSICENVIIGAGATVLESIMESGVYVGTPARRIK